MFRWHYEADFEYYWIVDNFNVSGGSLPPGFAEVSIADASVAEGDSGTTALDLTVTCDPPNNSGSDITVTYTISDGTAVGGVDYDNGSVTGTITFPDAGGSMTAQTDTVTITVNGDTDFEGDETVNVTLSNLVGSGILSDASAVGTINNDDSAGDSAGVIFTPDGLNSTFGSLVLAGGIEGGSTGLGAVYGGGDYNADLSSFYGLNLTTGAIDSISITRGGVTAGPAITGLAANVTTFELAYDASSDAWYLIGRDDAFDWFLYEVDIVTGAASLVATYSNTGMYPLSLAIASDGTAYSIFSNQSDFQDVLNTVDLSTGVATPIGGTGTVEGGWPIQPMDVDPDTDELFAIHRYGVSNSEQEFGTFNTSTGVWTGQVSYTGTDGTDPDLYWALSVAKTDFSSVDTDTWMMAD
jgi:hypothetical protein